MFQHLPGPEQSRAPGGVCAMLIRDKAGGPLLQAELEEPLGGSGAGTVVADNGRKSFEIDAEHAKQVYRLISATKREVEALKGAGYTMEPADDFEAREA